MTLFLTLILGACFLSFLVELSAVRSGRAWYSARIGRELHAARAVLFLLVAAWAAALLGGAS